jgi:hypothetical protein
MAFSFAWAEPMEIKRASIWRALALAKVEALKESE